MRAPDEQTRTLIRTAAHRLGVESGDAHVLHQHSNSVIALPSAGLVLRVAGSPDAFERVAGSVRLCRWLASRGYSCTIPADHDAWQQDGHVISAWRLEEVTDDAAVTMTEFGMLLRGLHDQPVPPFRVRKLTAPFASVTTALRHAEDGISDPDRDWLTTRTKTLGAVWEEICSRAPAGLAHGDAHPGNVMRLTDGRVLLGDWDHTATGPREWDLIQAVYTARRFGQPAQADLDELARAYGRDIRGWPHCATLVAVREITGLSPYIREAGTDKRKRAELTMRIESLRSGDETAHWHTSG
jgi:Ser/Thr protein kinase RdoA (MazF antagonist)